VPEITTCRLSSYSMQRVLLGARNQAFTTEYVAGLETVKSLQMEPQLNARYSDYLAEYLRSGFTVRQIGNTYNALSNGLEQMMTLGILIIGAWTVMNNTDFTIGMLVAFQMFASRLSQPMLRLVGLWQQFQQANLSVQRMGDIMNAPAEPYSILPTRLREGKGQIDIEQLSFRYADNLPFLYEGFNLKVAPGKVIAIMGPSGSGKSTLTKLLQGFYQPAGGTIKIDGCGRVAAQQRGTHRRTPCGCNDIRYLSANELRHYFGVVPQETILILMKRLAIRLSWQTALHSHSAKSPKNGDISRWLTPAKSLVIRHPYENEPLAASFSAG
jgi:ATP-binding cassette, subfamily B, bacterial HlyB/CyaB